MAPIVSIVGRTNSGKTTLIEKLVPALSRRGHRVATIKHHHHGDFEADHPGKDSWRHAQAGAVATALAGAHRVAVFQRVERELSPEGLARLFVVTPDLILTEGYIALVTDGPWDLGVPRFGLGKVERLADLLVQPFLGGSLTPPRAESESA
jgi:molybdopterin-guanine dinucleotide biosynthesis protein MobB